MLKGSENIWCRALTCLGLPNNKEKYCSYFCERGRKMEKTEEALLLFLALGQMGLVYSAEWKKRVENYLKLNKITLT